MPSKFDPPTTNSRESCVLGVSLRSRARPRRSNGFLLDDPLRAEKIKYPATTFHTLTRLDHLYRDQRYFDSLKVTTRQIRPLPPICVLDENTLSWNGKTYTAQAACVAARLQAIGPA